LQTGPLSRGRVKSAPGLYLRKNANPYHSRQFSRAAEANKITGSAGGKAALSFFFNFDILPSGFLCYTTGRVLKAPGIPNRPAASLCGAGRLKRKKTASKANQAG